MSKINEININIKKAIMTQLNVELGKEGKVDITIRGQLLTDQGKAVSDFWFNNGEYITDEKKIVIPPNVHMLIGDIFKAMTPEIYKKMNDVYKQLPASTKEKVKKEDPFLPRIDGDDNEPPF